MQELKRFGTLILAPKKAETRKAAVTAVKKGKVRKDEEVAEEEVKVRLFLHKNGYLLCIMTEFAAMALYIVVICSTSTTSLCDGITACHHHLISV
jgi:hypothetical protein